MEKYLDLSDSEHYDLLLELIMNLDKDKTKKILDVGSGKTSLSILLELFPYSRIDAIVYPNDTRKIDSIVENIVSKRCLLAEVDICNELIVKKYDLVVAHLLLGEAEKWGNTTQDLLMRLVNIEGEYLIIFDILEDPSINFKVLELFCEETYELVTRGWLEAKVPHEYENFTGKTYVAYLYKRK